MRNSWMHVACARLVGWRDAVGRASHGRRLLDLRDGHAGSRHRVGGPGGERKGRRDGVRQPGGHDQPGPLAAAGRHAADRRRRPLRSRLRHHGRRRQRRQCVRGDTRRVVLLRAQRDAGLQARLLERLLYGRGVAIRGQLVGALLRPKDRVADARRRHQRRVQGQRLALDRRRSLRPLRRPRTEGGAQQPPRRPGRQTEVRGRRVRVRRHGRV